MRVFLQRCLHVCVLAIYSSPSTSVHDPEALLWLLLVLVLLWSLLLILSVARSSSAKPPRLRRSCDRCYLKLGM